MTDLRTAAQQALEALEALQGGCTDHDDGTVEAITVWCPEIITALKAALAEPVQEPDLSRCPQCGGPADNGHDRSIPPSPYFCTKCMAEPVPVAWMHVPYPGSGLRQMVSLMRNREPSLYAATVPLFIAPPQRPAEPVQEPVAWIQPDHLQKARRAPFLCRVEPTKRMVDFVPLYAAPPQRLPLTEEEIQQCFKEAGITIVGEAWTKAIRAIERAHGIT